MKSWFARLVRLSLGLLGAGAAFITVAIVAVATAAYVAASGHNVHLVRQIAAHAGSWISGQHTDEIGIDLAIDPDRGHLDASVRLRVRAVDTPRRTFFFLLNPGLDLSAAKVVRGDGAPVAAQTYRLWLLAAVELEEEVAAGQAVTIHLDYSGRPSLDPFGGESGSLRADRVLLGPESFWLPYDAQSFFAVEAQITLPSRLTLVHNGPRPSLTLRGTTQEVRWRSERPVAGMALIAGRFTSSDLTRDGVTYRVFRSPDVGLDPRRIADSVAEAFTLFSELFGESGYSQLTVVADREIFRAFNDGSGLMGVAPRYFRHGDYGHHLLAHETAHVWWGGTISERWLRPGTGGQWIVEGWATFAAALASERRYGDAGLTRVRRDLFFDPDHQGVIRDMSFLDNVFAISRTRDTIYRKGGYVALMLRDTLGDQALMTAVRQLFRDHRYQQLSDADLQRAFESSSGVDLADFFDDWIRSDRMPDLALERRRDGRLEVHNRGRLPIVPAVDVAMVGADGDIARVEAQVGATVAAAPAGGLAVIDPELRWADMWRENNRHPPRRPPFQIAALDGEHIAVVHGSGMAWDRSTVDLVDRDGETQHSFDFERGLASRPRWSADGQSLILSLSRADGGEPNIVTLHADGKRRVAGRGRTPTFAPDGTIVAANGGRIVRFIDPGRMKTILERPDWVLRHPVPSPSGRFLLYQAHHRSRLQLRIHDHDGGDDRLLLEGERDEVLALWAPDESAVYAVTGHEDRWHVLRLPLGAASPTTVAADIGSVAGFALSPGGTQIALLASLGEPYPDPRHGLFVVDLRSQRVETFDVEGQDLHDVVWLDPDALAVVARRIPAAGEPRLPAETALQRVVPATGAVTPLF